MQWSSYDAFKSINNVFCKHQIISLAVKKFNPYGFVFFFLVICFDFI